MIYLDYAANTPPCKEVLEVYIDKQIKYIANPNSTHPLGQEALVQLTEEIDKIRLFFDKKSEYEVIMTSGASEANNLAIKGIAESYKENGKHIISTFLEHPSIGGALTYLQQKGYEVDLVNINKDGKIDLAHLKELLRKDTILVAVSFVDSELGTIQPLNEIVDIIKAYPNCHLHCDATQGVGKLHFNINGITSISFTPHKFYGLNGSGVLLRDKRTILSPLIHGGNSLSIYRSGTPDLANAAATQKALELSYLSMLTNFEYVAKLNNLIREKLKAYKDVVFNSPQDASPYILNLSVKGIKATEFKAALEIYGICISIKSACSVANTPSKAVMAVCNDRKTALSSWRISLSHLTTYGEIEEFLSSFDKCYNKLRIK